jgi:flagellar hook-basal body complex protein FliE
MTIESIAALGGERLSPEVGNGIAPARLDFAQWVEGSLARVGQSIEAADANVRALAAGQDVPVHEVMISLERARMDLTLAAEVRNRLVEAYQELTRMQL